jgi:hypothetical protein
MGKAPAQVALPQLIPVEASWCGPAPNLGGLDANEGCFCGDAGGFVIKKNDIYPHLPHCEWFCSSLAQIAGIPQVGFNLVKHTDGTIWFGSSWRPGRISDWWLLAAQGAISFADLVDDLSRIYAFDLFVHNDDRHLNNYMVVSEGGGHRVYAYDYSRAWLYHGFPMPVPLSIGGNNTIDNKEWMKANLGYVVNVNAATQALDNIGGITSARIKDIVDVCPANWLTDAEKRAY